MTKGLKTFLIFGRDKVAANEVKSICNDFKMPIITLKNEYVPGRPVPGELERTSRDCDAAIVLATADDVGALRGGSEKMSARARENVWIELGWFWAELGLERTLLIVKSSISPPSDLSGLFYLKYRDSVEEVREDIGKWIARLSQDRSGASVDLLRSTSEIGNRNADYQLVHGDARTNLVISGIGMANVRQDLPNLFNQIESNKNLRLEFVIPSDRILDLHERTPSLPYRPTSDDINIFIKDLRNICNKRATSRGQVSLRKYDRAMTFVATTANLGEYRSAMLVEIPLEEGQFGLTERPRMLLRKRTLNGLYDRFSASVMHMLQPESSESVQLW